VPHSEHKCDSGTDWYEPGWQSSQLLLPPRASKRPLAHTEQRAAAGKLKWPAVQFMQRKAPKASSLCFPASHGLHCDADAFAANLPPSHCLQSAALPPLYCPAEHELHDADPVALVNLPATHASQYVMPPPLWILPVSHTAQCALDVCSLSSLPYWPAVHSVQLPLACELHDPAAHCPLHELLVDPPVPNRPATQSVHAVRPVSS
jgi:hypothetical protein